jgi:hypothetical protein
LVAPACRLARLYPLIESHGYGTCRRLDIFVKKLEKNMKPKETGDNIFNLGIVKNVFS